MCLFVYFNIFPMDVRVPGCPLLSPSRPKNGWLSQALRAHEVKARQNLLGGFPKPVRDLKMRALKMLPDWVDFPSF